MCCALCRASNDSPTSFVSEILFVLLMISSDVPRLHIKTSLSVCCVSVILGRGCSAVVTGLFDLRVVRHGMATAILPLLYDGVFFILVNLVFLLIHHNF